jgi:hypothetical protein
MLTSNPPAFSSAYIFGSFLHSDSPHDLDLLIIYDDRLCPPSDAYRLHVEFVQQVHTVLCLDIHLTLLTQQEEQGCGFIEDTGAIPFDRAILNAKERLGKPSST